MSTTISVPPNIASIAGPPLVGIMLNWFLYGILVMQTYVYYQCFPEDRKKIKALVYTIFLLDTVQSVLGTADAFHWFAKGFGNMEMLSDPYISAFDAPILDGIIAFIAQTFFCWRIWVLQKSWWLPGTVFLVGLASLAGAIATGVGAFQVGDLKRLYELKWQLCLWLGGSALADTLIAAIMTYLLLRSRSRDHEQTDNILTRIVRLTVETNTITASVAITVLVCLLAIPKNPSISMAPAYALGKLYSNTLLAVFNNRVYMTSKGFVHRANTIATSGIDVKFHHPHPNSTISSSSAGVTATTTTTSSSFTRGGGGIGGVGSNLAHKHSKMRFGTRTTATLDEESQLGELQSQIHTPNSTMQKEPYKIEVFQETEVFGGHDDDDDVFALKPLERKLSTPHSSDRDRP